MWWMDEWMNAKLNAALGFRTGWGGSTGCIMHRVPTSYNYNMCVRLCVRPSDGTVPRFNGLAEPARTVGFRKREPARTVGFRKREPRSWWLMRRVVREDQETEIMVSVRASVRPSRCRNPVSGPWRTDGQTDKVFFFFFFCLKLLSMLFRKF
jgi:hypothetical protein